MTICATAAAAVKWRIFYLGSRHCDCRRVSLSDWSSWGRAVHRLVGGLGGWATGRQFCVDVGWGCSACSSSSSSSNHGAVGGCRQRGRFSPIVGSLRSYATLVRPYANRPRRYRSSSSRRELDRNWKYPLRLLPPSPPSSFCYTSVTLVNHMRRLLDDRRDNTLTNLHRTTTVSHWLISG